MPTPTSRSLEVQSQILDVHLLDVLAQIEALLRGGRDVQREALRVRSIAATNGRQRKAAGVKIRKHIGRMRKECRELSRVVDQLDDIATQLRGVL